MPLKNCPLVPKSLQSYHLSRRQFLTAMMIGSAASAATGCGMYLHPERRGQPAGEIDWKIVSLDAIGLLLFFVPGLIAFAVDFSTGAIYLPSSTYGAAAQPMSDLTPVETLKPAELTQERIERTLIKHTGKTISLEPGTYQATKLDRIENFWKTRTRLLKQKTSNFFQKVNFPGVRRNGSAVDET